MGSIDTVGGIGVRTATKLRKSGIRTTEALLKRAGTRKGRRELAATTGLAEKSILEWVNRADLMRVKGVGSEYADLLEAAGVDTVRALRNRNAANLLKRMTEVNRRRKLVQRMPTLGMVDRWVVHAGDIEPSVSH